MKIISKFLPAGQFLQNTVKKSLIVLHFTAGSSVESAYSEWVRTKQRIGAHFIVDRDGAVYQTVPESNWIYALGVPQGDSIESRTLHIEMVNVGPLRQVGQSLNWWPRGWGQRFCGIEETDRFVRLDAPWRGERFFERYPVAQIEAAAELCRELTDRHDIPRVLPAPQWRNVASLPRFRSFSGIAAHDNFRQDKTDVSPAFPWLIFEELLHRE